GPDLPPGGIHVPLPGGIHVPLPGPDLPGGIHLPRPGGLPGGGLDFPGLRGGVVLKNEQETDPPEKPGQEQGQDEGPPPTGRQPTEINEKTDLTDTPTQPAPSQQGAQGTPPPELPPARTPQPGAKVLQGPGSPTLTGRTRKGLG